VLAVPVAPAGTTAEDLSADELICCAMPPGFRAVGSHYLDFSPTSDEEVVRLLDAEPGRVEPPGASDSRGPAHEVDRDVEIVLDAGLVLRGHLDVPASPRGVVLFAHGSGSSRLSPRNQYVARILREAGLGTLLLDLLTASEEDDRSKVFDIPLLGSRLALVGRWLLSRPEVAGCRLGIFGASTGAGAALWAAAEPGSPVAAVVSRGGRPDLAGDRLSRVRAPTLLIVGGADLTVLELNRDAQSLMQCPTRLMVVPTATHLFEEPGTLEQVARLAATWFTDQLEGDAVERGTP
jgi:putative phosphoribosyl transferase